MVEARLARVTSPHFLAAQVAELPIFAAIRTH
jgi:hypothetical protein